MRTAGTPDPAVNTATTVTNATAISDNAGPSRNGTTPPESPDNGAFQQAGTARFANALRRELGQRRDRLGRCTGLSQALRAQLGANLDEVDTHLQKFGTDAESIASHQDARGCFDAIRAACVKPCEALPPADGAAPRSPARTDRGRDADEADGAARGNDPVAELQEFFGDLGALANELKRFHNTRHAKVRLDEYARREADNLRACIPGLKFQRPGSELKLSHEVGVGGKIGFPGWIADKLFSIGPTLEARYLKDNRFYVDEDRNLIITQTKTGTVQASAVAKQGSVFSSENGGEGEHAWNVYLRGRRAATRGNYQSFNSLEDAIKAQVNREANSWKLRFRSGDDNSAGNRFVQKWQTTRNAVMQKLVGVKYAPTPSMPNIATAKMEKGAFNTPKIIALADRLSSQPATPPRSRRGSTAGARDAGAAPAESLAAIVRLAYPETAHGIVADPVGMSAAAAPSTQAQMSEPARHNPLNALKPLPAPGGAFPADSNQSVRRSTWAAEAGAVINSLDWAGANPDKHEVHALASASIGVEFTKGRVGVKRLLATHAQIEPGYTKDLAKSEHLLTTIRVKYAGQPKIHLAEQASTRLAQQRDYWSSTRVLVAQRLDNADVVLRSLRERYIALVGLSERMDCIARDKQYGALPTVRDGFARDFAAFAEASFGIPARAAAQTPQQKAFLAGLRKDPKRFMSESYDAISVGLATVGIDIYKTKKLAFDRLDPTQPRDASAFDEMERTDLRYASLRQLMADVLLPIDQELLRRAGCVQNKSESLSSTWTAAASAAAGLTTSASQWVPANQQDPTATSTSQLAGSTGGQAVTPTQSAPGDATGSASDQSTKTRLGWLFGSGSVGAGVAISGSRRTSSAHPNPVREGEFTIFRFSVRGEGLLTPIIERAARWEFNAYRAARNLRPFRRTQQRVHTESGLTPPARHFLDNSRKLLERAAIADYTKDGEFYYCAKKPLSENGYIYEGSPQCVRVFSRGSHTLSLSLGVPLHALGKPVTVFGSGSVNQTAGNVLFETIGTDPGYHILMFPEICKALNLSIKPKLNQANDARAQPNKPVDPTALQQQCDFGAMRRLFAPAPASAAGPAGAAASPPAAGSTTGAQAAEAAGAGAGAASFDSDYLLHKFFGNDDSILGVAEKFAGYLRTRRDFDGEPMAVAGPRTEFHRFDDHDQLWHTVRSMREAERFTPGALVHTAQKDGQSRDAFWNRTQGMDPRPTLERAELQAISDARHYLKNHPGLSPQERMAYFLGDQPSAPGRVVFQAYCKIIAGYEEINAAAKSHHTYDTEVV